MLFVSLELDNLGRGWGMGCGVGAKTRLYNNCHRISIIMVPLASSLVTPHYGNIFKGLLDATLTQFLRISALHWV